MKPDGVLFSNGPGDPSAVPYAVETVKEIIGKVAVFGICMGHQLLGQALGGKTFKMNGSVGAGDGDRCRHDYTTPSTSHPYCGGVVVNIVRNKASN